MRLLDDAAADLRFAARSFRRAPGFTFVAFATLVVGIAAVTSIFSYMDAVYFAALPYKDADRIVALNERRPHGFVAFSALSLDAVHLIRQSARSFDKVSAYTEQPGTALFGAEPRAMRTLRVDSAFLPLFDLHPELGRLIAPEEITTGAPALMISDQLWRTAYGGDPDVLGKSMTIDARAFRIVGVLPPRFRFPYQTDAITGLGAPSDAAALSHEREYAMIGRLRAGVSRDAARAELRVLAPRLEAVDPKLYARVQLEVRDEMLDRKGRQFLPEPALFLGAGLFVLLIACANVANLFLVRAAERQSEMAIRASLGAGRARLVRQGLSETLLLGTLAAACGTGVSIAVVRMALHLIPTSGFPSWFHVAIDTRVLAFAIGVTMLVTMAVGLVPALEGTRFDLVSALKRGGDGGVAKSGIARAGKRGIALQLALSVALFVGAALLVRSYQRLAAIDFGYPADRIAVVHPLFDPGRYANLAERARFTDAIVARARELPGIAALAVTGNYWKLRSAATVVSPDSPFDIRLIPDRDSSRAIRTNPWPEQQVVSDAYFSLLDLRLRAGRNFAVDDVEGSLPVTVVSAQVARALWPSSSPIGHTIQVGAHGDAFTVIGVVDDVPSMRGGARGYSTAPVPTLYVSTRQALSGYPEILATGAGDVRALRAHIVELVRAADPALMLLPDITLASQVAPALADTRIFGSMIGAFALSALVLSLIGIYGVVAFGVARRTREIGIRIALGGTPRDIMRVVVGEGMRFASVGIALGLLLSAGLGRLIKSFLYDVSPLDPAVYAVVCVGFGVIAMAACWWPARRVTHVDPLVALRAE